LSCAIGSAENLSGNIPENQYVGLDAGCPIARLPGLADDESIGSSMRMVMTESTRLGYAFDSLTGLSVGDALGAQYFMVGRKVEDLQAGVVPPPVWEWTDDTEMACSVVWMLAESGHVDQDKLASAFAERCEPNRGYGAGAFVILHAIRQGMSWQEAAGSVFDGQGSMGNGAAMRVAPLGAYFSDDVARAVAQARLSAQVTHTHPEGVVGAIAVAVAASQAAAGRLAGTKPKPGPFLDAVLAATPESQTRRGIARARKMLHLPVAEVAYELGSGHLVLAQDTVPFALWVAARRLADYPQAITDCVTAGGDIDTTSAIVGGIVAAHTGPAGIPATWRESLEPLPPWLNP
jgi:ADP-ribosylglycohydrolase